MDENLSRHNYVYLRIWVRRSIKSCSQSALRKRSLRQSIALTHRQKNSRSDIANADQSLPSYGSKCSIVSYRTLARSHSASENALPSAAWQARILHLVVPLSKT